MTISKPCAIIQLNNKERKKERKMNIRFKQNCGFTVIESVDDNGEPTSQYDETFITDEVLEGDIVDDEGDYVSFQFGDSSMIFGLKKELFEIVED